MKEFLWGTASSAIQVEGANKIGGRTPTIWDSQVGIIDNHIKNNDSPDRGVDFFYRYKYDIQLMKELGVNSYRFSVSWSRILTESGQVNPDGVEYYNSIINELLSNNIEPIVTIYHWDLPLWVHKNGGWINCDIIEQFCEYVRNITELFSDRVRYWITINEPQVFATGGYLKGTYSPYLRKPFHYRKVVCNVLSAHAKAVKILRKYASQQLTIGYSVSSSCFIPKNNSPQSVDSAYKKTFGDIVCRDGIRGMFRNAIWNDLILNYKSNLLLRIIVPKRIRKLLNDSKVDFVGLNIYTPMESSGHRDILHQERDSLGWLIDEQVMYWTIKFFWRRYRVPIMISENGVACDDRMTNGKIHDEKRIQYLERYIGALKKAIGEGIPVLGYLYWSLTDNFEWNQGYAARFGLYYVDYTTMERVKKDSADVFKRIVAESRE